MRDTARRLAVGVAMVLSVGSGVTLPATQADAAGWGCSGTEVSGSPYDVATASGAVYSSVHLYWDGSTGTNCAVNVKTGGLYGTPTYTDVTLASCAEDGPEGADAAQCTAATSRTDPPGTGTAYGYYAGPVQVPGAGHCLVLEATTLDTNSVRARFQSRMFHC
jgi:hypothetical protein